LSCGNTSFYAHLLLFWGYWFSFFVGMAKWGGACGPARGSLVKNAGRAGPLTRKEKKIDTSQQQGNVIRFLQNFKERNKHNCAHISQGLNCCSRTVHSQTLSATPLPFTPSALPIEPPLLARAASDHFCTATGPHYCCSCCRHSFSTTQGKFFSTN